MRKDQMSGQLNRIRSAADEQAGLNRGGHLTAIAKDIVEAARMPLPTTQEVTKRVQAEIPLEDWLTIKDLCARTGNTIGMFARAAILSMLEQISDTSGDGQVD